KPAKGEVLVVVSGFTGCGKSAIAGEIEIAMKAIGVPVQWTNGDAEKHMTGADWLAAIEAYKPTVRIVEVNVPRAAGIKVKGE
ncbi:ATP-binding protein, partial [Salmonella enterica subsp. salamae]|nr:ead/Ea22-like family protein [Salmonella enterica]ECC1628844.1 ATP-binding protein [Salmonella enterica subsp. salamae]